MMVFWILAFVSWVSPVGAMYGPLELASEPDHPDHVLINVQYLEEHTAVPIALQHAELSVPYSSSFPAVIQQLEHTGCSSHRLEAVLAVVRQCRPTDSLTTRPSALGDPEISHPDRPASSSQPSVIARVGAAPGADPLDDVGIPPPGALAAPAGSHGTQTSSSPALSPVTDHEGLPPPSLSVLYEQEVADIRELVLRIHRRLDARRGGEHGDADFAAASWYSTLRQVSWVLHSLILPVMPSPAEMLLASDSTMALDSIPHDPSTAASEVPDTVDLSVVALNVEMAADLRELGQVDAPGPHALQH